MTNKFPVPPNTRTQTLSPDTDQSTAFQECFDRYQECLEFRSFESSSKLMEEVESYILDFEIAARRSLASDAQKFQLFRKLFLENRATEECCSSMRMDRFTLAKMSKQIKATVGGALIHRGLFPLNKYFTASAAVACQSPQLLAA